MYLSEHPAGSLSSSTITIIFVKKHKIYPILQWPKQIIGSTKEAETNLNTTVTGGDLSQGHGNKNSQGNTTLRLTLKLAELLQLKNKSLKIKNYEGVHRITFQKEASIQTRFVEVVCRKKLCIQAQ